LPAIQHFKASCTLNCIVNRAARFAASSEGNNESGKLRKYRISPPAVQAARQLAAQLHGQPALQTIARAAVQPGCASVCTQRCGIPCAFPVQTSAGHKEAHD